MKVVLNIAFIILCICLVVSLAYNLSPTNSSDNWRTIGVSSFLGAIENAPTFDVKWVDKYLTIKDVNIEGTILTQGFVDFVNDWLLAPIKIVFVIGTTAVNFVSIVGYWLVYVFKPI